MEKFTEHDVQEAARKNNVEYLFEVNTEEDVTKIILSNGIKRTMVCVSPAIENPLSLDNVCMMVVSAIEDIVFCTKEEFAECIEIFNKNNRVRVYNPEQRYVNSYYKRRTRKAVLKKRGNSHRCELYKKAQRAYMRGGTSDKCGRY